MQRDNVGALRGAEGTKGVVLGAELLTAGGGLFSVVGRVNVIVETVNEIFSDLFID